MFLDDPAGSSPEVNTGSDASTTASSTESPIESSPEKRTEGETAEQSQAVSESKVAEDSESREDSSAREDTPAVEETAAPEASTGERGKQAENLKQRAGSEENGIPETPPESVDIGELMAGMPELSGITPGKLSKGEVVKITDADVMVDIGLKSEGAIPRAEFLDENGQLTVALGDQVDFIIEDYDEEEGTFTVSHRKAAVARAWEDMGKASREGGTVKGRVLERTKGGLTVLVAGVRAFLPASQADSRPLRNPDSLIGQEIECKVIKLNQARSNAVVSRKAVLDEENSRRKTELAGRLMEGEEITGQVKNLTSYGAFVDLGGMDGLLHVTDLAWGRVSQPSEVLQVGQEVRVKVLKYDREKERISLGMKQLMPDPWERVVASYRPGDNLTGRVVSLTDYGAFCEVEPGIEGLIHVSEMTWSRHHRHPSKFVKVGDAVEVQVLDVNSAERRISLSLRQKLGDPWDTLAERIAPGAVVEGRVRNLTDYGAFVEIEDGVEGLIHVSDLSWTRSTKHPSEVLKKGQKVKAAVVSIDAKQRRISLGLKQLQPDAWQAFFEETEVGSIVPGKVVRLAQFGAFVELREGIESLCHASEMGPEHGAKSKDPLKVGAELPFRVLRLSPEERRIGLSLKKPEERRPAEAPEKRESKKASVPAPEAPKAPAVTTMGEKMAQAIQAAAARRPAQAPAKTAGPAPVAGGERSEARSDQDAAQAKPAGNSDEAAIARAEGEGLHAAAEGENHSPESKPDVARNRDEGAATASENGSRESDRTSAVSAGEPESSGSAPSEAAPPSPNGDALQQDETSTSEAGEHLLNGPDRATDQHTAGTEGEHVEAGLAS